MIWGQIHTIQVINAENGGRFRLKKFGVASHYLGENTLDKRDKLKLILVQKHIVWRKSYFFHFQNYNSFAHK